MWPLSLAVIIYYRVLTVLPEVVLPELDELVDLVVLLPLDELTVVLDLEVEATLPEEMLLEFEAV